MAGVLDALASYVTNMLAEMAKEEVAMLIGVPDGIKDLSIKLGDLKNFLADADRRNITDENVRGWVGELKRAMYLATDIIDLCQLKAMEQGQTKDRGCLNPLLFCMRNPLHAHDIGTRIKMLNQNLDDICKRGSSFNFIKLEAYEDRKTTRSLATNRKTDSLVERSGVVGEKIEEDTKALVEVLTKEAAGDKSGRLMVVAIVGGGGIGKTTLSKKVFNDESIKGKFAKKIWLSITREFNEVELLSTAITAAGGDLPEGGGARDKALLVVALRNAISDKKFLLVLDDMWGVVEWDKLLMPPFSYGGLGSRVLITTRHDTVARGVKAMHPHHHVEKLNQEDAWSLLRRQILTSERSEPDIDMLKDIGLQIIAKCDGLPLAIKVMGGLLCQKKKERRVWENVLHNNIWSVSQMPEELNYAIHLSYEELSPCLKQCFLHYSLKPTKTNIVDTEFVNMWIAEGFIYGNTDRLEELGIECYKELLSRNLIEPINTFIGEYFCNMHDVVRSFAQFVTRNEALVAHDGETIKRKLSLQRFLRLSIETRGMESDEFEWRCLEEQESLRTLILTGCVKIQPGDSLITCPSLRVLHIESANLSALVRSMDQLKHLRYLTIKHCNDIKILLENIHNMKFLQHIGLEGCKNLVNLPNSIVRLIDLRFLDIDDTQVNSIPKGFCALTNLRSLWGFQTQMYGDWCSLEELGPLSRLMEIGLCSLKNVSAASFAMKARLGEKVHLSIMDLCCNSSKTVGDDGWLKEGVTEKDQEIIEEVFDELCPPTCIEDIRIRQYSGRRLPRWLMLTATTTFGSLRMLMFDGLGWCTQLPNGLCQIPCLEYLEVNYAPTIKRVGLDFVQPGSHRLHSSSQVMAAFPKLHEMILMHMVEWEEWEWEQEVQAMPILENLTIKSCKLRCIPPGLAFHGRALKKLTIWRVQRLQSLENFSSVADLDLYDLPDLTSISNFPKLQKLEIDRCQKLKSLQEMNALRRLKLTVFYDKKRLPMYLQAVKPCHLLLDCSPELLASIALGRSGPEWERFSHIQHVEAYADDLAEDIEKRWHLFYTSEPYSMEANIDLKECSWSESESENEEEVGDKNEVERMGHDPVVTLGEEEE